MDTIKDPDFWIAQWQEQNRAHTAYHGYGSAATWNTMAGTYARDENRNGKSERVAEQVAFLEKRGVCFKKSRVLDVGCGPGSFAFAFAEKGAHVTCLDISENMISTLNKEMSEQLHQRIKTMTADWKTFDLETYEFTNAFDLVFANMTPAISGPQAFIKLVRASRRWCWFCGWAGKRENPLLEDLHKNVFSSDRVLFSGNFMLAFNLAVALGYFPECSFSKVQWTKKMGIDEATNLYCSFFQSHSQLPAGALRDRIASCLRPQAQQGIIESTTWGHTGAMFWNVSHSPFLGETI